MMGAESLSGRFDVRTERFEHGGFSADLLLPSSPEALIDEAEFDADERMPYWAELWPSARAVAREILDTAELPERAIEVGCGVGLPSLALQHRGVEVVATDYYADALLFARHNAERNRLPPLRTRLLDWRHAPADLPPAPLVVAADVLYERRNVEALVAVLPKLVAPGGCLLLGDPGRAHLTRFTERLTATGWVSRSRAERLEPSPAGRGLRVTVRLLRFTRPEADQRPPPKL
jgi:predicted nicotinamide N-methyase